jgi:hypothetical protein
VGQAPRLCLGVDLCVDFSPLCLQLASLLIDRQALPISVCETPRLLGGLCSIYRTTGQQLARRDLMRKWSRGAALLLLSFPLMLFERGDVGPPIKL